MDKTPRNFRIFIVDDSMLMRERLTELFHTLPRVEVCGMADNAPQAIAALKASPVDVVILDLDLVAGSGLDVLKAVKQDHAAPTVIILTIHSFHDFGRHCLDAGADYFFEKGNAFDGVLNLLEQLSLRHAPEGAA